MGYSGDLNNPLKSARDEKSVNLVGEGGDTLYIRGEGGWGGALSQREPFLPS